MFSNVSFIGFLLIGIFLAGNGILYISAGKIMSYHQIAMGKEWEQLTEGEKIMSLSFMKSAGAGFLSTSASIIFLLFVPFQAGEKWSLVAILTICIINIGIVLSRIVIIRKKTVAKPPMLPFIVLLVLAGISFIISI